MKKWEPYDIIVFIITIVIGFVLVFREVRGMITDHEMSPEAAKFIAHATGGLIAVVSLYIGSKLGNKKEKEI